MQRVAVNALVMSEYAGGLGVYITQLVDYMLNNDVGFEPVIYFPEHWVKINPHYRQYDNVHAIELPPGNPVARILKEPFFWPQRLKKDGTGLFFSPMSYIPLGVSGPTLLTIHDLRSFHERRYYTALRYHYLKWMIKRSAIRADQVIAISEFTAQDIVDQFGIDRQKIAVIYEGINADEYAVSISPDEQSDIHERYGLKSPYILSIGHLEPRKNFSRLIDAFDLLRREHAIPHQLVIVGKENWYFKELYQKVRDMQLQDHVLFTRFVDQKHIPALYQMADLFITASTFEGFGFTPLESMAAGTPVVAANCTSLPEVVGKAAILCDPYSVNDIAKSIYSVISDTKLQSELCIIGKKQIEKYNWETCCKKTVKLLENFLNAK